MRVGGYRVVYWVDEEGRVVSVERIAPRGEAYGASFSPESPGWL